jgi:hypothetical protein
MRTSTPKLLPWGRMEGSERNLTIKIDLPDDISRILEERWGDLPRHVLETLAIQGYRDGTLSSHQVQHMLGLKSRLSVDAFMKKHGVSLPYDAADLEQDSKNLRTLLPARSR